MKLQFTRIKSGGHDVDAGKVWIEDGVVRSDRKSLEQQLRRHPVFDARGKELSPHEGDRYLQAMYQLYGRGSYLRCEMIQEERSRSAPPSPPAGSATGQPESEPK